MSRVTLGLLVLWSTLAAAQAPERDVETARTFFRAAVAHYQRAEFKEALAEFEAAHDLSGKPEILFNISRCHERMVEWPKSIVALQRYVKELPNAEDRPEVEARIKLLQSMSGAKNAAGPDPARDHFFAGVSLYEKEDFNGALREFEQSYKVSQRDDILYNISRCHEKMAQWNEAIAALEKYLSLHPPSEDRGMIEARLARFRQFREAAKPQIVIKEQAIVDRRPFRVKHRNSLILAGITLACGAVSLGTGLAAHELDGQLTNACPMNACKASERSKIDREKRLAITSDVFLGLTIATAVTTAILYAVETRPPRHPKKVALGMAALAVRF